MKLRKTLILSALCASVGITSQAEEIQIGNKTYKAERLIERKIGPGTTYLRLRLPDYPLNVNMLMVDLNNPYNKIETTIANESAKGTEKLVNAAKRQDAPGHRALAATNGNFWYVESKYTLYYNIVKGGSIRNGKMVTEYNVNSEKWDGGPTRTGVVGISDDRTAYVDYCEPTVTWVYNNNEKKVHTCNKGFRTKQYAIYNSFYGRDREFMPYYQDSSNDNKYTLQTDVTDGLELYFKMDEGQEWMGGKDISFTCTERKTATNARGKLGDNDLAIIAFGGYAAKTDVGQKIKLKYDFKFQDGATPNLEQGICGNALVMRHGELTDHNNNEEYNSQVYSRTGYGCSADGKTVYQIVIDKATDPTYGTSAGCSTAVMCEIARHFGCYNMANFDAGGSAEMMVDNKIINQIPAWDSEPRAVANGWMIFNVAPEDDNTISALAFDHPVIDLAAGASFTPTLLGYNKYESLINKNVTGFTLSCDPAIGKCEGNKFIAGTKPASGLLTASYNGVSVSKNVDVAGGSGINETLANDRQILAPGVTAAGENFTILADGVNISKVNVISMSGQHMDSVKADASEVSLNAPAVGGLYLLAIECSDGRLTSKKLLVK